MPHTWWISCTSASLLVEILDEQNQSTEETGKIVVTDLQNLSTPVVRYDGLADYGSWATEPCTCGLYSPRIKSIEGRIIDSIQTRDGNAQSPYTLTNAMGRVEGIIAYQIIQEEVDRFKVRVVVKDEFKTENSQLGEHVQRLLSGALKSQVHCELIIEEEILPATGARKVPLVISMVTRAAQ